jgi:ligand-binding SRPBCC domain-containing protein
MTMFRLESRIWLRRPLEVVFPFFSDARNLERLTPPWLRFEVLTAGEIPIAAGTRIAYRLRLRGIPVRWESEITAWDPPHRFVDEQRRGPYRLWIHEHLFRQHNGLTLAEDRVQYAVPGGALVNRWLVAPDLARVFRYRREKLAALFGEAAPTAPSAGGTKDHASQPIGNFRG